MALAQTFIWDHAFKFPPPTKCIFQKTINFSSKEKFNGESEIPTIDHLFKFIDKCKS